MTEVSELGHPNTLLSCPTDSPQQASLCRDLLADADALVGVAVTRSADQWVDTFSDRLPRLPSTVDVVDVGATVRSTAVQSIVPVGDRTDLTIRTVSDPGNLTKLGVTLTETFEEIALSTESMGAMCFGDLTALAQHHDRNTLFQFLEVLTSMCESGQIHGHYHVHPGTVNE